MSCFQLNPSHTKISIPKYEKCEKFSTELYVINVKCYHEKEWTVQHRFKDFAQLHEILLKKIAIAKDFLPGKKILKNDEFLEQRKHDLERYLQSVTSIVQQMSSIPLELIQFLDLDQYDIFFLLQKMALELSRRQEKVASFTILELHSISERLRLPCPTFQLSDMAYDFSHILEFCSQLEALKIVPTTGEFTSKEEYLQTLISPIGNSNILPSTLNFELKLFTNVKTLSYLGIVPQNITSCDPVRTRVTEFTVNFTRAQNIQQILVPELVSVPSSTESLSAYNWTSIKQANFGHNDIWTIDLTMQLMPKLEHLHLNNNRLRTIANLSSLYNLNHLDLSGNIVESLDNWFLQLGNIEVLNLSSNKLKSLAGLSRLRSLRSIDLCFNQIEDFEQIEEIAQLPIVEVVSLNGNPLTLKVDCRSRVLARFDDRCADIMLDNEKCSPHELDKAMVFAALRKTKPL